MTIWFSREKLDIFQTWKINLNKDKIPVRDEETF